MIAKVIRGGLIGGITAFIWVMISWGILPWHQSSMQAFKNEGQVAAVITQNIDGAGVYVLPFPGAEDQKQVYEMAERGPVISAVVCPNGINYSNPWHYIVSLITYLIAAGFVSRLLLCTKMHGYWCKVSFITMIGFLIGWCAQIPDINWGGVPISFAVINIVDSMITWFLAGLLMARFVHTCCGSCKEDAPPPAS